MTSTKQQLLDNLQEFLKTLSQFLDQLAQVSRLSSENVTNSTILLDKYFENVLECEKNVQLATQHVNEQISKQQTIEELSQKIIEQDKIIGSLLFFVSRKKVSNCTIKFPMLKRFWTISNTSQSLLENNKKISQKIMSKKLLIILEELVVQLFSLYLIQKTFFVTQTLLDCSRVCPCSIKCEQAFLILMGLLQKFSRNRQCPNLLQYQIQHQIFLNL